MSIQPNLHPDGICDGGDLDSPEPFRVARAEAERARTVIDREHTDTRALERADRRQPVDPTHVDDGSGRSILGARTTHRADSAEQRQADLQSSPIGHTCVTPLLRH